jgi:hypothetical protein
MDTRKSARTDSVVAQYIFNRLDMCYASSVTSPAIRLHDSLDAACYSMTEFYSTTGFYLLAAFYATAASYTTTAWIKNVRPHSGI